MASAFAALQRGLRRVGWGLGDQAVSSLTNFFAAATVAHLLSPKELGAYSLAYVTYAVALNASRGLATDPLMVRLAGAPDDVRRRAVRQCTGTALLVGVTTGLLVLVMALLLPQPTKGALLALGVMMPALMLQDSWRFSFFVAGQGSRALVNDLVWALSLVPLLVAVGAMGERTAFWFMLAWGGGAAIAAAFGLWQARVLPRPDQAWTWLMHTRDLGLRFMLEGMAGSLATQIRAYGVGIALGLTAVGYLQVVNTLMGPIVIVMLGTGAVIVPELAQIQRRSPVRMQQACLLLTGALGLTAVVWGAVLWLGLPHGLGDLVVGSTWEQARPLVPLATLAMVTGSIPAGAGGGLHALGAARRSLRAMLIGGALSASLSVAGAFAGGLRGALLGTAVASFLGGLVWWHELRTEVRLRQASVAVHPYPEGFDTSSHPAISP